MLILPLIILASAVAPTTTAHRMMIRHGPDIHSKLFQQDKPSVAARALTQSSSTIYSAPYRTARLSYSNFTYSFPVTSGQKFIRLYFYPTSYEQGFDRSKAFFSVTSDAFTLLKDFNASLTADADDDPRGTIFREYCINIDDGQRLNLTFSPSTIQPDFYAFINGIQMLSMPTHLYYTNSESAGFKLLGSTVHFHIANNSALQTEYRLNVGGNDILPKNDTGLLRYWETFITYLRTTGGVTVDYSGSLRFQITQRRIQYTEKHGLWHTMRLGNSPLILALPTCLRFIFARLPQKSTP
ncbi:hypothetical protein L6164_006676 [Bauhinia variegata]|uniref:Uncharacterized protein n=1 Tax=Bauhinia variegata TaxID=167791 RepID=A0ACB9PUN5_BAUVA|nr:hypothetical protein L6164_006676 [Bauhinia variegata]